METLGLTAVVLVGVVICFILPTKLPERWSTLGTAAALLSYCVIVSALGLVRA